MFGLIAVILFAVAGVYYLINKSVPQALVSFGLVCLTVASAPVIGIGA